MIDNGFPVKYDHILNAIDSRCLFDASLCWKLALKSRFWQEFSDLVYYSLQNVTMLWYAWLFLAGRSAVKMLKALIIAYTIGPLLYMLVPACGPLYAGPGSGLVRLSGLPNCVPSLHLATAVLFVIYRPKNALILSLAFTIGTAFATLATGEHYVIDLLLAVPFACFAADAANSRWMTAGIAFLVVLAWALGIRFLAGSLIAHPGISRSLFLFGLFPACLWIFRPKSASLCPAVSS
jgi:hypothetical protein